jgi:hypothetical protein
MAFVHYFNSMASTRPSTKSISSNTHVTIQKGLDMKERLTSNTLPKELPKALIAFSEHNSKGKPNILTQIGHFRVTSYQGQSISTMDLVINMRTPRTGDLLESLTHPPCSKDEF